MSLAKKWNKIASDIKLVFYSSNKFVFIPIYLIIYLFISIYLLFIFKDFESSELIELLWIKQ